MTAIILIADDNEANLALTEYLLRSAGHCTVAAANGEQALQLARASRPDLMVCDLQMPGLDGYAVLAQVRGDPDLRDLPVVALTAYSRDSDRTSVLVAGFNGYLSKPIDPERFVEQIEQHLRPDLRGEAAPRRA